ncbi:MAG: Ig-like domain-containing protein, partial [Kiritimatiellae bacterium]|nr:Ig-like domain-containing protein [Kiritimatiellia bacterium]
YGAAQRLSTAINAHPPHDYQAEAKGDRLLILQKTPGISAVSLTSGVTAVSGTAPEQTLFAYSASPHFLETKYPAYEQLYLTGTAASGDVIRVIITTLDGQIRTNEAVAGEGDNAIHLFEKLRDAMQADAALQTSYGCELKYLDKQAYYSFLSYYQAYLVAHTNTYEGSDLHVDFQVIPTIGSDLDNTGFSDNFNDNADDLKGKAMFFLAVGKTNLNASFTLDTTQLADGLHTLTFLAREGTGVGTWSSTTIPFRVSNTPLACQITTPVNLANFPATDTISITVTASSPNTITGVLLYVEGKQKALTNSVPWNTAISANEYGPGILTVQAEAMDNAGHRTLSDPIQLIIYQDTDSDDLPDWWEYQYFGGSTNAVATADTDIDSADNLAEYIASTVPTDTASVLTAAITHDSASTNIVLQWPGSSLRFYNVFYLDELLTSSWSAAESSAFRGWDSATTWTNTTTNSHRAYRIQAIIP